MSSLKLLTTQNAKTTKGEPLGYLSGILYLVPSDGSGLGNLCPNASAGCRAACLYSAGRGKTHAVQAGRMRKTKLFFEDATRFADMLAIDVDTLERIAKRQGLKPCVRLNGTSDIPWEKIRTSSNLTLMEIFPFIQFYDYTKRPNRHAIWPNYHLTFSRSEDNELQCFVELVNCRNVAIVFNVRKGEPLPEWHNGYKIVDGDEHDLRFLNKPQAGEKFYVIGLRAKGKGKKDESGFVWPT